MSATFSEWPCISILVPTFNEERHIEACLNSLVDGGYPRDRFEIIIADGESTDRTRAILDEYRQKNPMVRWVPNPHRFQAPGINLAANASNKESRYLVRVDAHARYPQDFLPELVRTSETTGAELVVFVNEPQYEECFQRAVAYAFSHPLGVGDSKYRLGKYTGPVEHGQQGCFRRECFENLGGYDTTMIANEDAELSWRVIKSGGQVYLNGDLAMKYYPRRTLGKLAKQYLYYGIGRAETCRKHAIRPRLRQLAPPLLVLGELVLLLASFYSPLLLLLVVPYFLAIFVGTIQATIKTRSACLLWLFPVLVTMHHVWGCGFLVGLLKPRPKAGQAPLLAEQPQ